MAMEHFWGHLNLHSYTPLICSANNQNDIIVTLNDTQLKKMLARRLETFKSP